MLGALFAVGCGTAARALPQARGPRAEDSPSTAASSTAPFPAEASKPKEAPDAEARADAQRLVVVAGGDVELARAMGKLLLANPLHNPLRTVSGLLATGDVSFVNLESQLSEQGGVTMSKTNPLVFVGPPVGAEALARSRITIVSTANNHAWDYGRRAFEETLENLDRVGVLHVGTGKTHEDAVRAVVLNRGGFRVAFLAVTDIWNLGPLEKHVANDLVAQADAEALLPRITELKKDPAIDAVLLSYHGGDEYQDAPTTRTRGILRAAIDAGADAVLGHHVHVVQGVEWRRGRPILYSLGNLLMQAHRDHPETAYGYLARLTFSRTSAPRLEACPYRMVGLVPYPFVGQPGRTAFEGAFFSRLRQVSALLGSRMSQSPTGEDGCAELTPKP